MYTDVVLSCKAVGKEIRMKLLDDQNPRLCEEIKKVLPLKSLVWHAVISGDNVGFFIPVVWTGFDNPQERNKGDVFLYANGQLFIVCYNENTEPGRVNKFGEIYEESLQDMQELGEIIRQGIMYGDEPFYIEASLA